VSRYKKDSVMNEDTLVTSYSYGDTIELSTRLSVVGKQSIARLNEHSYLVLATGEVREYQANETGTRANSVASVKLTMKRLRRLIGANFDGGDDQLWITLTYKKNMRDYKQMYLDVKYLMRKIKRKFGKIEYIAVVEPQMRGAYHLHVLMKSSEKTDLYIANKDLSKMWGQGFTRTKRLRESDNVSAYLMAYLSDIDMNNLEDDLKLKESAIHDKKIVKGARLHLYHSNMQIYRRSRGIVDPEKTVGSKKDVLNKKGIKSTVKPDYHKKISVQAEDDDIQIETEFYSLKNIMKQKGLIEDGNVGNE